MQIEKICDQISDRFLNWMEWLYEQKLENTISYHILVYEYIFVSAILKHILDMFNIYPIINIF